MDSVMDKILIVVMAVISIAMISWAVIHRKKQKPTQEAVSTLSKTLEETKWHLQYKKSIRLMVVINLAISLIGVLTLVFLMFLPIFQIKTELFGVTEERNFSIYDNYVAMKEARNEAARIFLDSSNHIIQLIALIIPAVILFSAILNFFIYSGKAFFDGDRFSFDTYKKISLYDTRVFRSGLQDFFTITCIGIGLQIALILSFKNAEFNFESDIPYTIQSLGNQYLGYYTADGKLFLKVFQNNFVFCNAITGYIAVPIIFFILAVVLIGLCCYIRNKLINKITRELVTIFKEKQE